MVLIREGADAHTSGRIYAAGVQEVLLYALETWVLKPRIGRLPVGSHHRVARRLKRLQHWRGRDGGWVYPPLAEARNEAGLKEVDN